MNVKTEGGGSKVGSEGRGKKSPVGVAFLAVL